MVSMGLMRIDEGEIERKEGYTCVTFWSCKSYRVCVNVWRPNEAPMTMNRKGKPKMEGCFLSIRCIGVDRSGFAGKTGMF